MGAGWVCFFRFPNVTIPNGSVITAAFIRVTKSYESGNVVEVDIYGNDVDDAVAPTSYVEYQALVKTTAKADWSINAPWTTGVQYDSPDISTIIQEIVDRAGWSSNNAIQFRIDDDTSTHYKQLYAIDYDGGSAKAELHVTWTPPGILDEAVALDDDTWAQIYTGYLTEDAAVEDANWSQIYTGYITEGVGVADDMFAMPAFLTEDAELDDLTEGWASVNGLFTDAVALNDVTRGGFEYEVSLTEATGMGDTEEVFNEYNLAIADGVGAGDAITAGATVPVSETLSLHSTLGWAWGKVIEEDLEFTDVATADIALSVREVLFLTDALHNNWTGTENISDTLSLLGQLIIQQVFNETAEEPLTIDDAATYLHKMLAAIADTLGFTEEAISQADFYPVIAEALAITGLVEVLTNLNNTAAETLTLTDTTGVGWGNVIDETLGITDTATILWYAMCLLTDSITFTEEALGQFQFSDTISDVLAFTTTLALNQILNNTIEETLNFGIVVELDDELWECWVLNTNAFHASVYSGYEFNSYSVFNDVAYGCKPGGIYKLSGTTDDGSAFKAGIVLPETYFGSVNKKRFRKAYFGLSGGVTPALRVETDSGSTTYTITNSKANITRDMYGRQWVLKVQDFDDLDFIELVPIILAR